MDNYVMVEKWKREMDRIVKQQERERKRKAKIKRGKKAKQIKVKESTYNVPYDSQTSFSIKVNVNPVRFAGGKSVFKSFNGGKKTGKRGFAKVKKYKKTNVKHAMHLLRIDTERQGLAPRPAMLLSSEGYTQDEIAHKILSMHELDTKKTGGRKQSVAYLEIFCAFEDKATLQNYINYLAQKYNTEVFAVIHDDESVEHVHILVNWKNKEGKALRLSKGEFTSLWRETIKTLQPSREWNFKRGEGLKPAPFRSYLNAWRQGQNEYVDFVKQVWDMRQKFYQFEEENPHLFGKWKKLFFEEWLEEYDPARKVLQSGVSANNDNANESLRHFTQADTPIKPEPTPQPTPQHTEEVTEMQKSEEIEATDDTTTVGVETVDDLLRQEFNAWFEQELEKQRMFEEQKQKEQERLQEFGQVEEKEQERVRQESELLEREHERVRQERERESERVMQEHERERELMEKEQKEQEIEQMLREIFEEETEKTKESEFNRNIKNKNVFDMVKISKNVRVKGGKGKKI